MSALWPFWSSLMRLGVDPKKAWSRMTDRERLHLATAAKLKLFSRTQGE